MEVQTFDDVFDALADTPAEAANMKARADLLSLLVDRVKSWGLPQARQIFARRPGQSRHGGGAGLGDTRGRSGLTAVTDRRNPMSRLGPLRG
jgi:hypothetical protein